MLLQSPTLSVPLKTTTEIDWITPLKKYIRATSAPLSHLPPILKATVILTSLSDADMGIQRDIMKNVQHSIGFGRICGERGGIVPQVEICCTDTMAS